MQELRKCIAQEKEIKYGLAAFGNEVEQIEIKQSKRKAKSEGAKGKLNTSEHCMRHKKRHRKSGHLKGLER